MFTILLKAGTLQVFFDILDLSETLLLAFCYFQLKQGKWKHKYLLIQQVRWLLNWSLSGVITFHPCDKILEHIRRD